MFKHLSDHLLGKSCSFGQSYVLFVMSICSFGCFPFWFRGQDLGSDCVSFWSLLTFYLWNVAFYKFMRNRVKAITIIYIVVN